MNNQKTKRRKVVIFMSMFYLFVLTLTELILSAESEKNFFASPKNILLLVVAALVAGFATTYAEEWIKKRFKNKYD